MMECEIVRHQVAIAGRVTDAQTGKSISGAQVDITAGPSRDRSRTAEDGHFHFLDLPDGKYVLNASLPGLGERYGTAEVQAEVSRDAQENIKIAAADMALQPTTVKGRVTRGGATQAIPVVVAEVRIKGSGERTFSDGQGNYLLTSLQPGKRTVQVYAQGCQPASKTAELNDAGSVQTLDFTLTPSTQ